METQSNLQVVDDFEFIMSLLPFGWETRAKELGALRRCRKIPNARVLLQVLLIHLAEGLSLRATAAWAKQSGLIDISDVTIMDRLHNCEAWFQWMNQELMSNLIQHPPERINNNRFRIRIIDGTHVHEPGQTGSCWRIHYAIDLPSLQCSELYITDSKGIGTGEKCERFTVNKDDLFIGDRVYGVAGGIAHVIDGGGNALVRFGWKTLQLCHMDGKRFDLFAHLRTLHGTQLADWSVCIKHKDRLIPGRICALRRSRQAATEALKHAKRRAQKDGSKILEKTLEATQYVFVFTSVDRQVLKPAQVLDFYRGRWQVELVFKRLKSIMALGHLRKYNDEASRAWLQGKLLIALLIEVFLRYGESFFPWGYPLWKVE